ncbi:hypothetical protein LINPERHAP1_LOCUS28764 [Linum perenne]
MVAPREVFRVLSPTLTELAHGFWQWCIGSIGICLDVIRYMLDLIGDLTWRQNITNHSCANFLVSEHFVGRACVIQHGMRVSKALTMTNTLAI